MAWRLASIAHFTLFLGVEGDIASAGATKANHWFYPTGEADVLWSDAPDGPPPHMTASFGSLKDPSHDPGPRQKHTGQLLVCAGWSTVARWADWPPGERGGDYAELKHRVEATLKSEFERHFPGLFLAGQDVASPGIPGALMGGLLAAASVDARVFPHFRR